MRPSTVMANALSAAFYRMTHRALPWPVGGGYPEGAPQDGVPRLGRCWLGGRSRGDHAPQSFDVRHRNATRMHDARSRPDALTRSPWPWARKTGSGTREP